MGRMQNDLNFVFLDPPYWKMVDYGEGWSSDSLIEFYSKFDKFIKEIRKILGKEGRVALLIMPLKSNGTYYDLGFEMYKIIQENGFKIKERLCVPLIRNWSIDSRLKDSKEKKEILIGSLRDLVIFEK